METIAVRTPAREVLVDITAEVLRRVVASGTKEGLCIVYVPHTTAGITINENADPSVKADITAFLRKMVPAESGFRHAEGNSDAHIKASLVGSSACVPIAAGQLALGAWQGICFAEFDGPRQRQVFVQIIKGA
ncbi:MAG: secondary thiamine-phosphate synthase enzyme YjbQ [Planctomycetota bacterium]